MAAKTGNKKSNGEQSDLCDLEQVTLKPQLQAHQCLTTWRQKWYHSLLWGDSIRNGADLEKQKLLIRRPHCSSGEINLYLSQMPLGGLSPFIDSLQSARVESLGESARYCA